MNFEVKSMYNFMISHTFPGLLLLIEILLVLQWFANIDIMTFIKNVQTISVGGAVILLVIGYAISTLLGTVLDATNHFIFDDFMRTQLEDLKFLGVSDSHTMSIYKHFLEDDLWYYYEEYANLSFAMIPGLFLFIYWLSIKMNFKGLDLWVPIIIYLIVISILLMEAWYTYHRFSRDEETFIKVYSNKSGEQMLKTEVMRSFNKKYVEDIVRISQKSYPNGWVYEDTKDYYEGMLKNKNNILIILIHNNKNIGFLHAIPQDVAVNELHDDDSLIKNDSNAYYIESAAIIPDYRNIGGFPKMLEALKIELRNIGVKKINMHARISNGLSKNIQNHLIIKNVRRMQAWRYYNFEEPTDYIQAILS